MADDYTSPSGSLPGSLKAKEVLRLVDEWSKWTSANEANKLWTVLTALRGPDKVDALVKKATTAVIRNAAVPNLTRRVGATLSNQRWVDMTTLKDNKAEPHFVGHIRSAVESLELIPPAITKIEIVATLNRAIDKAKEWHTATRDEEARVLTAARDHIQLFYSDPA